MQLSDFVAGYKLNHTVLEETASTNADVKAAGLSGADEGTVISALSQTAGRGRLGRTFESPKGNVYLSVLLRPNISADRFYLITVAAAVAASRAIDKISGEKSAIKWVNDIYLNGKKVCGILAESVIDGDNRFCVLGMGVNLFKCSFSDELSAKAGYIIDSKPDIDIRTAFINDLLSEFFSIYKNLSVTDYIKEYAAKDYLLGKKITFLENDVKVSAVADGISDDGGLFVKTENGRRLLRTGEVLLLPGFYE